MMGLSECNASGTSLPIDGRYRSMSLRPEPSSWFQSQHWAGQKLNDQSFKIHVISYLVIINALFWLFIQVIFVVWIMKLSARILYNFLFFFTVIYKLFSWLTIHCYLKEFKFSEIFLYLNLNYGYSLISS